MTTLGTGGLQIVNVKIKLMSSILCKVIRKTGLVA